MFHLINKVKFKLRTRNSFRAFGKSTRIRDFFKSIISNKQTELF